MKQNNYHLGESKMAACREKEEWLTGVEKDRAELKGAFP